MPKETPPRASNRWEGTHTYKKPETEKRRARTVAQLREEAAASSKANREEAFNRRRGSIAGGPAFDSTPVAALLRRRGLTGGISLGAGPTAESSPSNPEAPSPEQSRMPGSGKKLRNKSGGGNTDADENGTGVDPALICFLNAMKHDIVESTKEAVGRIKARLDNTEKGLERLERRVEETDKNLSAKVAVEVARQLPMASVAA